MGPLVLPCAALLEQQGDLVFFQRLDYLVHLAREYAVKGIEGQVDAVVRDPRLREIVGTYAFAPVPGTDL